MPDDTIEDTSKLLHTSTGQQSPPEGSDSEKTPVSPITQKLSEQQTQQRADILSNLHKEPASANLQAFFGRLAKGSSSWDIDHFIEGLKCFADLSGPERVQYYGDKPLLGLLYPNAFAERWNETYPRYPITVWNPDFKRAAPPGWFNGLMDNNLVLVYQGDAPLGQGINDLLRGPTTLDCGMWKQLAQWIGLRYLIGDELFHKFFKFGKGEFTLSQAWDGPVKNAGSSGSLLYPFYDTATNTLESQTRIQLRTFYNHPAYLNKHPGGAGPLWNVIQVDDHYIAFDQTAAPNILSKQELEQLLVREYNLPRDFADLEVLWLWKEFPGYVQPCFAPHSWGMLAEAAEQYADHTLDDSEWENSRDKRVRSADGFHYLFNFERLIICLEEVKGEDFREDVLFRARRMKHSEAFRVDVERFVARVNKQQMNE